MKFVGWSSPGSYGGATNFHSAKGRLPLARPNCTIWSANSNLYRGYLPRSPFVCVPCIPEQNLVIIMHRPPSTAVRMLPLWCFPLLPSQLFFLLPSPNTAQKPGVFTPPHHTDPKLFSSGRAGSFSPSPPFVSHRTLPLDTQHDTSITASTHV